MESTGSSTASASSIGSASTSTPSTSAEKTPNVNKLQEARKDGVEPSGKDKENVKQATQEKKNEMNTNFLWRNPSDYQRYFWE